MFKQLIKFSFSYSVIEGVQKGILFLLIPVFTHYMSTEEYGIVSTVLMVIPFLSIIFALTIQASIGRYYFKYEKEPEKMKDFLGSVFCFQIIFSACLGLLTVFWGKKILIFFFKEVEFNPYIIYAIIISVLQPIMISYFTLLKTKQHLKMYIFIFNLYFVLQILLMTVSIVFLRMKQDGYLLSLLISNIVGVLIVFVLLFKDVNIVIKKEYLVESLRYSLPIIPVDGVSLVNSLVDRFYILKFIGLASVGIYYVGVQISSIIALIALAINSAYVPMFFKHYESGDKNHQKIYRLGDLTIYFIGSLTAVVVIFSYYFINIFFNEGYQKANSIILYLCFLSAIKSVYFLNTNVLSLEVRLIRLKTLAILLGAGINIIIGYFLTKHFSIIGAAISTLIGFSVTTFMLIYLVLKKTTFRFNNLKYLSFILYLFLICFYTIKIDTSNIVFSIIIKLTILLFAIGTFLLVLEHKTIKKRLNGYINIKK